MLSNQERQFERLFLVQPRIAVRCVIETEIFLFQLFAATDTLRNGVARKFEMHAAEVGVMLFVDAQRRG